jgi:hypothetical protein
MLGYSGMHPPNGSTRIVVPVFPQGISPCWPRFLPLFRLRLWARRALAAAPSAPAVMHGARAPSAGTRWCAGWACVRTAASRAAGASGDGRGGVVVTVHVHAGSNTARRTWCRKKPVCCTLVFRCQERSWCPGAWGACRPDGLGQLGPFRLSVGRRQRARWHLGGAEVTAPIAVAQASQTRRSGCWLSMRYMGRAPGVRVAVAPTSSSTSSRCAGNRGQMVSHSALITLSSARGYGARGRALLAMTGCAPTRGRGHFSTSLVASPWSMNYRCVPSGRT